MKRIACLLFSALLSAPLLYAQQPYTSSADILQKMQQLNTLGSVLYIAAHPDDENTRLLPYLTGERKLRTGYLSLTRGDGGQNLIGKEQGEPLGLIRTHELLAARRIDGAEQFFTRANDFGFSKNPEETFTFWNKDSILADVVWVIRTFKPDVIITRFPTTGEGGHGHHTASAILAVEAFQAAADATKFPEQLAYTEVWQAKRIFWNTFNFGTTNTTSEDQVKLNIGGYNPLLGKSYGEISSENRSMHKSQGFGTAKTRGNNIEYFKQLSGDPVKNDILENIDVSWNRFSSTAALKKSSEKISQQFNTLSPESSVPALVAFYKQVQALPEQDPLLRYWKKQKLKETTELLIACTGLWMEAYAVDYMAIPGKEVNLTAQIINRNKQAVTLNSINYLDVDSTTALSLKQNELYTFKHKALLKTDMVYSNPYWLNEKHTSGLYTVNQPLLIGKPENDPAYAVLFQLTIQDIKLSVKRGVSYKYTDPVKGEIYRPLELLPALTLNVAEKVYVCSDTLSKKVQLLLKANTANLQGRVQASVPAGWTMTFFKPDFSLTNKGDEIMVEGLLKASPSAVNGKIAFTVTTSEHTYTQSINRIEYDHIPYQFILSEAEANLVNVPLKKTGTNIGYIPGAGDDVVACLRQVGYSVTLLTDELLNEGHLQHYDAIITGVRAYNTNDRLQVYYTKLMNYVSNGGNLIVQYNTNNRIGPLLANIGPFPFTISRDRVTDEKAEVRILDAKHIAFNYPNVITAADFNGWVQERGIYFATEVDKQYTPLLSMNDPKEKAHEGSLITTPYGKGNFVYTGLAFFRELPAGVPGAYRLFVNLISLPKKNTK